jgi:hypothetical protein
VVYAKLKQSQEDKNTEIQISNNEQLDDSLLPGLTVTDKTIELITAQQVPMNLAT